MMGTGMWGVSGSGISLNGLAQVNCMVQRISWEASSWSA